MRKMILIALLMGLAATACAKSGTPKTVVITPPVQTAPVAPVTPVEPPVTVTTLTPEQEEWVTYAVSEGWGTREQVIANCTLWSVWSLEDYNNVQANLTQR
jgi:hypothetical protein